MKNYLPILTVVIIAISCKKTKPIDQPLAKKYRLKSYYIKYGGNAPVDTFHFTYNGNNYTKRRVYKLANGTFGFHNELFDIQGNIATEKTFNPTGTLTDIVTHYLNPRGFADSSVRFELTTGVKSSVASLLYNTEGYNTNFSYKSFSGNIYDLNELSHYNSQNNRTYLIANFNLPPIISSRDSFVFTYGTQLTPAVHNSIPIKTLISGKQTTNLETGTMIYNTFTGMLLERRTIEYQLDQNGNIIKQINRSFTPSGATLSPPYETFSTYEEY